MALRTYLMSFFIGGYPHKMKENQKKLVGNVLENL